MNRKLCLMALALGLIAATARESGADGRYYRGYGQGGPNNHRYYGYGHGPYGPYGNGYGYGRPYGFGISIF